MRVVNNWCKTRGIYYRNIKVPTNFFTLYGVREIQIMATDLLLELSPKCHRMHHLGVNRLYCSETDRPVPTSSNCIYILSTKLPLYYLWYYTPETRGLFSTFEVSLRTYLWNTTAENAYLSKKIRIDVVL